MLAQQPSQPPPPAPLPPLEPWYSPCCHKKLADVALAPGSCILRYCPKCGAPVILRA